MHNRGTQDFRCFSHHDVKTVSAGAEDDEIATCFRLVGQSSQQPTKGALPRILKSRRVGTPDCWSRSPCRRAKLVIGSIRIAQAAANRDEFVHCVFRPLRLVDWLRFAAAITLGGRRRNIPIISY